MARVDHPGIVARILLGAATETELEDKRLRYEDAINALKGGIAEGMVPGGGSCYAYMTRYVDEIKASLPDDEERLATDITLTLALTLTLTLTLARTLTLAPALTPTLIQP